VVVVVAEEVVPSYSDYFLLAMAAKVLILVLRLPTQVWVAVLLLHLVVVAVEAIVLVLFCKGAIGGMACIVVVVAVGCCSRGGAQLF
jgi:hypothetical protein